MPSDFQGLQVRGDGDDANAMGATMINIAMALMREVKEDLKDMSGKLDAIAKERRDEAREHGGLEVRVSSLESSHKAVRGVSYSVAGILIVGLTLWLLKIAIMHPESISK